MSHDISPLPLSVLLCEPFRSLLNTLSCSCLIDRSSHYPTTRISLRGRPALFHPHIPRVHLRTIHSKPHERTRTTADLACTPSVAARNLEFLATKPPSYGLQLARHAFLGFLLSTPTSIRVDAHLDTERNGLQIRVWFDPSSSLCPAPAQRPHLHAIRASGLEERPEGREEDSRSGERDGGVLGAGGSGEESVQCQWDGQRGC